MSDSRLTKLVLKNFITSVKSSIGSPMFQHIYVRDGKGRELEVLDGGKLSCAYVVSSLLTLHGLIDRPHATVATTLEKMAEHGWQETDVPGIGAVVFWPEYNGNQHIGIMIGPDECVSNSSVERTPVKHGLTLSNGVRATKFYTYPTLTDEK